MLGPPPSAWGGEGGDAPAWGDFSPMDFGGFEGGDAPWMGDFSGSDTGEEETDISEETILEGEE